MARIKLNIIAHLLHAYLPKVVEWAGVVGRIVAQDEAVQNTPLPQGVDAGNVERTITLDKQFGHQTLFLDKNDTEKCRLEVVTWT